MITVTDRVKRHLERMTSFVPGCDFCVHIYWSGETSDNVRSSDGGTVWTKVPARGWMVGFPAELWTYEMTASALCSNVCLVF